MLFHHNMYTWAGGARCVALVRRVLSLPPGCCDEAIYGVLRQGLAEIALDHEEVYDTPVRESIIHEIRTATGRRSLNIFFLVEHDAWRIFSG